MPRNLFWDSAAMFIRYWTAFRAFRADSKSYRYGMNSNGTELEQVVHTLTSNIVEERLAERVWFSNSQSSLLNIYFRLKGFQSSFLLIYFRYGPSTFTLHQNVADKTCTMHHFQDRRGAVTEMAPKSPFVCVNRSPISPVWLPVWYDFRYSMNIASVCRFVSRLCRTAWIVRTSAQKKPNSYLSSLPLVSAASVVFFPHSFLFFYWAFIRCSQTLWDYVLLLVRKDRIRVLSLRYIL